MRLANVLKIQTW